MRELFSTTIWKTVLDSVPQGLVAVNQQGQIAYLNPYAQMALGLQQSNAVGRHFRDVFCPSMPLNQCWVNHALEKREPVRGHRFEMERPAGESCVLAADLTPVCDADGGLLGAIITVEDNGTSKLLADRLQRTEETHEAILGSIADGLFTVDHEWRITSFNRAAEKLTGLNEKDVVGKLCSAVLQSDRCRDGCPLAKTLEEARNLFDYEVNIGTAGGQQKKVLVNTAVLFSRTGSPIGGVVSFRDMNLMPDLHQELQQSAQFEGMVGRHKRMAEIYEFINEVADSEATVIIMGESGTGKEMVANALVRRSRRSSKPFVKVNCSVFPDSLLESELFGHVKGAFTDARQDRVGRFELADSGTVLLDEIGEISPSAQLKLLRVLEEREFERLGSSQTIKTDVRVIAATNRDLPRLVETKKFREDLYYRLNVIPIVLPPLRERQSDIRYLIDHFLIKYKLLTGKKIARISDKAMDLLMSYHYPGNVRELENAIEHAFARTTGHVITEQKLPLALRQTEDLLRPAECDDSSDDECKSIMRALEQTHWNREQAAQLLGMSRVTLWRRMKALGIS